MYPDAFLIPFVIVLVAAVTALLVPIRVTSPAKFTRLWRSQ